MTWRCPSLSLACSAAEGVDPGQRPLLARLRVGQHDLDVAALLLEDERGGGRLGVGAGLALVVEIRFGLAASLQEAVQLQVAVLELERFEVLEADEADDDLLRR